MTLKEAVKEQFDIVTEAQPVEPRGKPFDYETKGKQIGETVGRADKALDRYVQLSVTASRKVVEFRDAHIAETGEPTGWKKLLSELSGLSQPRIAELARIGDAKDPFQAVDDLKEAKKAAQQRYRDRQKVAKQEQQSEADPEPKKMTAKERRLADLKKQVIAFVKDCGTDCIDILEAMLETAEEMHGS